MSFFLTSVLLSAVDSKPFPSATVTMILAATSLVAAALLPFNLTRRLRLGHRLSRTIAEARARLAVHEAPIDRWFHRHDRTHVLSEHMVALSEIVSDSSLRDRLRHTR